MDLGQYLEELRHQLLVAAEAGGEDSRLLAERLIGPLESAARLVLLDALSAAAGEITSELAPGSVDLRLRGREPEFVVTLAPSDAEYPPTTSAVGPGEPAGGGGAPVGDGDEGGTSRITLRLPEQLKTRLEDAAGRAGLSVNSWLVRTVTDAVDPADGERRSAPNNPAGGQHFTGWAR